MNSSLSADNKPRRRTAQQRAIEAFLDDTTTFHSAQDIHSGLRQRGNSIGLATVYRVLQRMVADGTVDAVRSPEADNEVMYRRCERQRHHHHLMCRRCGYAVEIAANNVETWARETAAKYGFEQVEHQIELFGLCAQCAE